VRTDLSNRPSKEVLRSRPGPGGGGGVLAGVVEPPLAFTDNGSATATVSSVTAVSEPLGGVRGGSKRPWASRYCR
jgi:hypothetical protein